METYTATIEFKAIDREKAELALAFMRETFCNDPALAEMSSAITQDKAKLTDRAGNQYYRPEDVLNVRIKPCGILSQLAELFLSVLLDPQRMVDLNSGVGL